jgi:hypothetical protein
MPALGVREVVKVTKPVKWFVAWGIRYALDVIKIMEYIVHKSLGDFDPEGVFP